ncbi:MAG: hypothetical protein K2N63_02145, partial [Lachnospiraceae bacterium]|nr:hypothetical protein [Lachnospiraceae bacterium]
MEPKSRGSIQKKIQGRGKGKTMVNKFDVSGKERKRIPGRMGESRIDYLEVFGIKTGRKKRERYVKHKQHLKHLCKARIKIFPSVIYYDHYWHNGE